MTFRGEDLLRRLVAIDTVSSSSNVEALELLAAPLEESGFRVALQRWERDAGARANLVAVAGPAEEDGLILSGHVDTVPFEGQPGWTRDPLRLEASGDRLYGRGTSDMKGFLVSCVEAVRGLDPGTLRRPVVVLVTADEEIGALGAERLAPELPSLLGGVPPPRLAWIGEPTSFRVFHAHKGVGVFDVAVHGRGGHSSRPDLGVNAITVMGRVLEALRDFQDEAMSRPDPDCVEDFAEAPWTTLNVGTIRGGTAANVIAEVCRIDASFRFLPGHDPQAIYERVVQRLRGIEPRDTRRGDARATIEAGALRVVPAMRSPRETPLERALCEALGASPAGGALFVTDGCRLARAGIAAVICGPGDLEQAHQPDESVSRRALERSTTLVAEVVRHLCVER